MSVFAFLRKQASFAELGFRQEHHCHLLPGVDDGVQETKDAVTILKNMISAGLDSVTLTPHLNPDIFPGNTEASIRERYSAFTSSLPREVTSSLTISLGAEYMVVDGFEKRDVGSLLQFCDDMVLIEMSYYYESNNMTDSIFHLVMEGVTPVIAHPERYLYLTDQLDVFDRWYDMGARYQLNLLSLNGVYGPGSKRIMEYLLKKNYYIMGGTDTHTVHHFSAITEMQFPKQYLLQLSFLQNRL